MNHVLHVSAVSWYMSRNTSAAHPQVAAASAGPLQQRAQAIYSTAGPHQQLKSHQESCFNPLPRVQLSQLHQRWIPQHHLNHLLHQKHYVYEALRYAGICSRCNAGCTSALAALAAAHKAVRAVALLWSCLAARRPVAVVCIKRPAGPSSANNASLSAGAN